VCLAIAVGIYPRLNIVGHRNQEMIPTSTPENWEIVNIMNSEIDDDNCSLPCWWSWIIGEDSLQQVQDTARIIWGEELPAREADGYVRVGLELNETMNAEVEESLIYPGAFVTLWLDPEEDMLIGSRLYIGFPKANYANLEPYSISGILSTYGSPDEVTLDLTDIVSPTELTLRYRSLGLYVQYIVEYDYTSQDAINKVPIHFCNDYDNILELQLQVSMPPEDINLPSGFWGNPAHSEGSSIDLVSALSVEAFAELFSEPDQCFEVIPTTLSIETK
jgi:hypothetical protein